LAMKVATSLCGIGFAKKYPCIVEQPRRQMISTCSAVSTPSTTQSRRPFLNTAPISESKFLVVSQAKSLGAAEDISIRSLILALPRGLKLPANP